VPRAWDKRRHGEIHNGWISPHVKSGRANFLTLSYSKSSSKQVHVLLVVVWKFVRSTVQWTQPKVSQIDAFRAVIIKYLRTVSAGSPATDRVYQWWFDGSKTFLVHYPSGGIAPLFPRHPYILPDLHPQSLPSLTAVVIRCPQITEFQFFCFVTSFQGLHKAQLTGIDGTAWFSSKLEAYQCFEECREKGYVVGIASVGVLFDGELW